MVKEQIDALSTAPPDSKRSLGVAYNNILFRLFIWRDMWEELLQERAWEGINFGKPQRSKSLEILNWAESEWMRDGWITPHNSHLHIIYRAGIIGVVFLVVLLGFIGYLTRQFIQARSLIGGLLLTILIYWLTIANTLVFLEFPYNAIPFWTLCGMTWGYLHSISDRSTPPKGDGTRSA